MDLTFSLGKNGKLGPEVEKDLNLIQKRWENLKVAGKTFNAQVSLSLHTEVQLSDVRKVESINESVQLELEAELSKRTSLKFDVKKEVYEVYKDPSTATPPEKEPEVTVGVSWKIGGGDDKKKTPETAKEKESCRVVTDEIKRNWQEYEKARDAIVSKLPENVREKAIKQMDRAAQSEEPFVASDDLKADLKAKGASSLEEEMKKAVKAYHDRILAQP
jgi:hypothetical protein